MVFLAFGALELLVDNLIVLHLLSPSLYSGIERILEVFGYLFLVKLLFHSVDNCHYSLDVFVKQVTLLQTLVRNDVVLGFFIWLLGHTWVGCFDVDLLVSYLRDAGI